MDSAVPSAGDDNADAVDFTHDMSWSARESRSTMRLLWHIYNVVYTNKFEPTLRTGVRNFKAADVVAEYLPIKEELAGRTPRLARR